MSRGLRELALVSMGMGEADTGVVESAVPAPELRESLNSIRPVDLLVIPLTARGRGFGALTLARRGGDGFDQDAVDFLEELAHSLAVTLDATRNLADSRRVAGVLSRDLAPPQLPEMPGARLAKYYRVAFEHEALGGDFYDVHGEDDDWTAVVGDVCGKGVEAAVLTGRVRQAVRTAALVDRSPAKVLDLVNRVLVSEGEGTFVTALCARVRRRGDRLVLSVAAAGHHPPYLLRAGGGLERVPAEGTVLGLFETHDYRDTEVVLEPGDTCLFFTDGVLEAPGFEEQFGEDRLHRVLVNAPRADVNALVETVAMTLAEHVGDRAHDDIAIVGLQNVPDPR
jgi:serine phosphatase RsbU (regulator of sigma subunit)